MTIKSGYKTNFEMGIGVYPPVEDPDYLTIIANQAEGNMGAATVLLKLMKTYGPKVFDAVAPNLGKGPYVWVKYKDECDQNMEKLIEVYGK